jgi:peroxiredoxin
MLNLRRLQFALTGALAALLALMVMAQAPQVSLKTTDDRAVNLSEWQGKVVVLSFGGTWVPLAAKELPALQKLADRYAARGVPVYWVSVNSATPGAKGYSSNADLSAFAEKNGFRGQVLRDTDRAAYRAFGVDALPTVVILNKDGRVARKLVGFDPDQAEAYTAVMKELDQLLK